MPRIPLSQILSTTTTPKHSNPKTAVISIAFHFLLTAKDQLPPHSFDTLISEFMLYEETLIPGTAEVYHDFGVVLCYIYEEVLNGYPELQNTIRQRCYAPLGRNALDAICKAVHLVQLVSRVRMIAGEAKYQAVLNSIRGCWSGKIDMATHIKQLRELFMKDYPDILAEFEEEWRPQRPADCFTSTLDAAGKTGTDYDALGMALHRWLKNHQCKKEEEIKSDSSEPLWRKVPSEYEKYKPWRPDIGKVTKVKQALGEIGEVESLKIVEGKSKKKK